MRADRLLAMLLLLQRRGKLTTQVLADELSVSRRTILRDVEALSFAGVPIYAEGGHGGGVALDENYRVSLTGLKEAEVRSLFIANSAILLKDIGLGEAAESTLPKLFAALPSLHQQAVEQIRQRIYIDPVWWWHDFQPLPFWAELQTAVYEDRYMRVLYENYNGEVAERVLEPYSLVAKASLWYLIALRDNEFRTYRVSRLHKVELLDNHFQRRKDFDLVGYWHNHAQEFIANFSQFTFTLRIDNSRINFAKWYTPGRCEIIETPSDGSWYTARFQVESLDIARNFALSLGTQAIVLDPPVLREAIIELAQNMLRHYEKADAQ